MAESTPPASPVCFVREDPPGTVVIDEPDLATLIHFHAGVAISDLVEEEAPAVGADDPDRLIDLLGSLLLQGEFIFCRHGESLPGHARALEWRDLASALAYNLKPQSKGVELCLRELWLAC